MSIRFKTPDGQVHLTDLCEPNLNLLAHAQAIELDVGSECGGHGVCGGDRLRIPADARNAFSPITEEERRHLSPKEISDGWRLGCQCFPNRRDLSLQVEVRKSASRGEP